MADGEAEVLEATSCEGTSLSDRPREAHPGLCESCFRFAAPAPPVLERWVPAPPPPPSSSADRAEDFAAGFLGLCQCPSVSSAGR